MVSSFRSRHAAGVGLRCLLTDFLRCLYQREVHHHKTVHTRLSVIIHDWVSSYKTGCHHTRLGVITQVYVSSHKIVCHHTRLGVITQVCVSFHKTVCHQFILQYSLC